MRGSEEEVRTKKERYDHFINLIHQRVLEGREDLAETLMEEAKALFDPIEEAWWIQHVEEEKIRAVMVREGELPGFDENPGTVQFRIFNHMTPLEWCQVMGPTPVVKDGVTLSPQTLELYMGVRDKEGTLGEAEVTYLTNLVSSRQGEWQNAQRLLEYASHVSAWDFLVKEITQMAPGPESDDSDKRPSGQFVERAGILRALARQGVLRETDRSSLELTYRAWVRSALESADRDLRENVLGARESMIEAIARMSPKDDHSFFYEVVESAGTEPAGSTIGERERVAKQAIEALDGAQSPDFQFLVRTVDSPIYPDGRIPKYALDRLTATVDAHWDTELGGHMREMLLRLGANHPSPDVRLGAIQSVQNYSCTDSIAWLAQLRAWSTSHRDEQVRAWAAHNLKSEEPFERIYRSHDEERAKKNSPK